MALAVRAMIGSGVSGIAANVLDGFVAVHFGHHDVHQDDGDFRRLLEQFDRLAAIGGGEDLHATPLQHA